MEAFKQVELGGVRLEEQARSRRAAEAERAHMDAATKEAAARYVAAVTTLSQCLPCLQHGWRVSEAQLRTAWAATNVCLTTS